ncbi:DUF2155 domain-containing protein [Roseixanthobacter pseudopolyaromaticivorans]|uniref:DUF2155 domain-containing protein n=1 Tax=Xanthobacteraceae TaxID=335928 RepID=UPI00372BE823
MVKVQFDARRLFPGSSRLNACVALVIGLCAAGPALAQSRSGIESAPLAPPSGFGSSTAPAPNGALPPGYPPPAQRPSAPQLPPPGSPRPPGQGQLPAPSVAQPPAAGTPSAPGDSGDVVVVQPPPERISNRTAVYAGLDKITGRITSFEVGIGETVQFGALQVTPRVCYTRPPTETQNTTSFTEVNEITLKGEAKRIFTGWMFASSPGLHGVEHPVYDVWLTDCKATPPATGKAAGQK